MYRIELSRTAESVYRWLARHDRALLSRIDCALESLKASPFQGKPLKGAFHGDFSLRVGSYRIIYTVVRHRLLVCVLDIGHRREIYRA